MSASQNTIDLAVIKIQLEDALERLGELEEKQEKIEAATNRWKGGAAAVIALGSVMGAIVSYWDKIKGLFIKLGV